MTESVLKHWQQLVKSVDRRSIAVMLASAAACLILTTLMLQVLGVDVIDLRPVGVLSSLLFIKAGLIQFWPVLTDEQAPANQPSSKSVDRRGQGAVRKQLRRSKTEFQPISLMASHVPTFTLDGNRRLVDWNMPFEIIFRDLDLNRGVHFDAWLSQWMPERQAETKPEAGYSRERLGVNSPQFGRMTFQLMISPVVDPLTGRVRGWNGSLQLQSVTKRQEFYTLFDKFMAREASDSIVAAARYRVMSCYRPANELFRRQVAATDGCSRVLELGAGPGLLTNRLLRRGHHVVAVEPDIHQLRIMTADGHNRRLRAVRREIDDLADLPEGQFGAIVIGDAIRYCSQPEAVFAEAMRLLAPGGRLVVGLVCDGPHLDTFYDHVRHDLAEQLKLVTRRTLLSQLKRRDEAVAVVRPGPVHDRPGVRSAAMAGGFDVVREWRHQQDHGPYLLIARKPRI